MEVAEDEDGCATLPIPFPHIKGPTIMYQIQKEMAKVERSNVHRQKGRGKTTKKKSKVPKIQLWGLSL